MLHDELNHFFEQQSSLSEQINILNTSLPKEWLEDAFSLTQTVSIRRRKLPPEDIIRLVIGMSLLRRESIQEVATQLAFSSKGLDTSKLAARSSLTNARQRLGYESVEWLFNRSSQHWQEQTFKDDKWHGLNLYSIDGTMFRTEDTKECRDYFGSGNTSTELESGYPIMRMTCLMNVRNHLVVRAAIGKYRDSEITQASQLVDNLPAKSVLLMDKLYHSAELLHHIESSGEQRHWVTPLKKDINFTVIEKYSDSDMLVERTLSSHARKKSPELPKQWRIRVISYQVDGHSPKLIATSLPHDKFSTKDIIELYHERWEIELGYRELKQSLLNMAVTLRSKKVDLVYQEAYGMLIAYNLIRHEAALAANELNVRPTRISFKAAMNVVLSHYHLISTAQSKNKTAVRLKDLTDTLKSFILPETNRPSYPRAVKINPCRYPLKATQRKKSLA